MAKSRYEVTRKDEPSGRTEFQVFDRENKPSWKRYGTGRASMRFNSHRANPFLELDVTEFAEDHDGRVVSSKRTMTGLDAETGRQLFAWLKSIYEPETKEAGR